MQYCSRKEPKAGEAVEKEKGLFEGRGGVASTTEVKVKITKKQLEQLLQRVEGRGLPIQQVLKDLLSMDEVALQERARHWRPALQSIPEFPE
ncbi:putative Porphobilinogen deaminase [Cocos nucifera]|uniref:Putative Porphobilinogen deaminase n=1 Tax=Cocos nucifera TaxID=13894 RepID=A0A8K0ICI9_COCNU|nr:putative Porphobilinogen deaminase [Cocos nucifera]